VRLGAPLWGGDRTIGSSADPYLAMVEQQRTECNVVDRPWGETNPGRDIVVAHATCSDGVIKVATWESRITVLGGKPRPRTVRAPLHTSMTGGLLNK
jgi:hypothetical protein